MKARIGEKAPNFRVSEWVQGTATNIDQEYGCVVLIEVFQVNCPSCFLYSIPEAISMYNKYSESGLTVIGIATAFEDFDKNTLENLKLLVSTGELMGETNKALAGNTQLQSDNKFTCKIPFPIGMDHLIPSSGNPTNQLVIQSAKEYVPDFDVCDESIKNDILKQVKAYLDAKKFSAYTFEQFSLKGTPSAIIINRDGILCDVSFGYEPGRIESLIKKII